MGRYRSPSRSYSPRRSHSPRRSPSPPSRRKRYDDPRDRYRGGRGLGDRRSAPSGLLVRNIPLDARPVLLLLLLLSISRVRVSYSLRFDRSVVYDSGFCNCFILYLLCFISRVRVCMSCGLIAVVWWSFAIFV